jgi:hypothetical protein
VPEVPTSAIYAGNEARLTIGDEIALRLDEAQSRAFRQVFLRLFWHESEEEAWSTDGGLEWRNALERPFDVPHLLSTSPVRLESAEATLAGALSGAKVYLGAGEPPVDAPAKLWFPAGPDHHSRLEGLVKADSAVVWGARRLPDMWISRGGEGEILFPNRGGRLRIRLSPLQSTELSGLLDADDIWRFDVSVRLGDERHRGAEFWLPGQEAAGRLVDEATVSMPEMLAESLNDMATTAPDSLAPAPALALSARYEWTVVPPRPPAGHEEDGLHNRWRKVDDDWAGRLKEVRKRLQEAYTERERLGGMFRSLLGGLLGFSQTYENLREKLKVLEAEQPSSAGPSRASELLAKLRELEEAASVHRQDLTAAEAKAAQDKDREEQRTEWERRCKSAERDLPEQEKELEKVKRGQQELEEQLQEVESSLKSADKAAREDLGVKRKRLQDDIASRKRDVKRLTDEVEGLRTQANEEFVFKPGLSTSASPQRQGRRFVPEATGGKPSVPVPDEALPETGMLRRLKGQRYLVIERWEQLTDGQKSAARLSAKLVALEEP